MKLYHLASTGTIESPDVHISPFITSYEDSLVIELTGDERIKMVASQEETLLLISNLSNALLALNRKKNR